MTQKQSTPLVVVSSRTGNTMILAHALCDACPSARLVRTCDAPENLSGFNPVLLGFWCDCGHASEEMRQFAARLENCRIGCFATMGADARSESAQAWMRKECGELAALGRNNTLETVFVCRGRIDPELLARMPSDPHDPETPAREARRRASDTHPDRLDQLACVEAFAPMLRAQER